MVQLRRSAPRRVGLLALASSLVAVAGYAWADQTAASQSGAVTVVSGSAAATTTAGTGTATASPIVVVPASTGADTRFDFGVQTHFHQGWTPGWLAFAGQAGARTLRDTVPWASAEKARGTYNFGAAATATLLGHCASGGKLILTIVPSNPLYDEGRSVYSDTGRAAYAAYVGALLQRFGSCVSAIEVGNEVNGAGALNYPAGYDRATTYTALLRALYAAVKPAFPQVQLLGGSANTVGTGFLEDLFAAGALPVVDGFAVHPYRGNGEGLALEIDHLNDVMRRYGTPKPVWATEFSYDIVDPRRGAAGMVKSVVELYAAGVTKASWYALVDQQWFPNMGLFNGGRMKPTGQAFRMLVDRVLPYGRPMRADTGTLPIAVYRIGADRWIAWGAPTTLAFGGAATVRNVLGEVVGTGGTVTLGAEPVLVEGAGGFTVTDAPVFADTLMQWGRAPWSYARRGNGTETALGWFDTDFTSHFGDRWSKPLRIGSDSAAPAGDGKAPMRAIVRYTAPTAQAMEVNACLRKSATTGDGVDYRVERNGQLVASGVLVDRAAITGLRVDLAAGDRLSFVFGPNQTYGGDSFGYRATLNRPGYPAPACA